MYASILEQGAFRLAQVADPTPGKGQVLARPLVCGVCGSDLHARRHAHDLAEAIGYAGFRGFMNPDRPVVLGHEFVCEILDYGAGCEKTVARGQRVTALPFMVGDNGLELVGFSNGFNGAMAQAMLLDEAMLIAVPDHVPTDAAALAEPLAVAIHAVNAAQAAPDCAFAVHGCGPVGQFIIARLRFLGLGPILAIDPNAYRRAFAERLGADLVIAPDADAQTAWWRSQGVAFGMSDSPGPQARRPIAFECVGKPGMLREVAERSPMHTSITVVGVCMETDTIMPPYLLMKEMTLRFVFAYTPQEFQDAMTMIAADPERLDAFVTGHGKLDEMTQVFDRLTGDLRDVKVLIRPQDIPA